jgi:glyoxylase-like metal-dependent hydrolase (beta-lactamase superfamily II)
MAISDSDTVREPESSRQVEGLFRNHAPVQREGMRKMLRIMWNMIFHKPRNTRPAAAVPVQPLTREALIAAPNHSVYRLGHSTVLLKMRDKFWITDPVFAERASPVQWAGPKRFHQPPISLEALPPIEAVILSHDHYDHLDYQAVLRLASKANYFLAPLGVGDTLIKWGVDASKVRQLDWWQGTEVDGIQFIATP